MGLMQNQMSKWPPTFEKRTVYLDVDGVVADFWAYATKVGDYDTPLRDGEDFYDLIPWDRFDDRFYSELPLMKDAIELFDQIEVLCKHSGLNLIFLTAIPDINWEEKPHVQYAFYDKVKWVEKHFGDTPVFFGPYSKDKHLHCKQKQDILIDDRESNVQEWEDVGGIGILHKNNTATLNELELVIEGI